MFKAIAKVFKSVSIIKVILPSTATSGMDINNFPMACHLGKNKLPKGK